MKNVNGVIAFATFASAAIVFTILVLSADRFVLLLPIPHSLMEWISYIVSLAVLVTLLLLTCTLYILVAYAGIKVIKMYSLAQALIREAEQTLPTLYRRTRRYTKPYPARRYWIKKEDQ